MNLMNQAMSTLLAAMVALGVLLSPQVGLAQRAADQSVSDASVPASDGKLFDQAHRKRIYDAKKLSYASATAWSLAFPGLGNIYSEQHFLAGLAFISMVFAGFFVGYGLWSGQSDLLWTGVAIGGVTYGWSLGSSLLGVRSKNEELRRSLHLEERASMGRGLVFTYRW